MAGFLKTAMVEAMALKPNHSTSSEAGKRKKETNGPIKNLATVAFSLSLSLRWEIKPRRKKSDTLEIYVKVVF